MNVEIGTEAPIFLSWEYLIQIFGILSLQCSFFTNKQDLLIIYNFFTGLQTVLEPSSVNVNCFEKLY